MADTVTLGQKVVLNSGGPDMEVLERMDGHESEGGRWLCAWLYNGERQTADFLGVCLRSADG